MSEVAQNINDIRSIFSLKKKSMVDRIQDIIILIKNKINVIKSFKKIDNYNSINSVLNANIPNLSKCYLSKERIKCEWEYHMRTDIMYRLHLLIENHYNLDELKYMNVELKLLSTLNKMSCYELSIYYNNVIKTLDIILKEWITVCKMYIDIEINYLKCCKNIILNKPVKLCLDYFSIDIKN